MLRDGVFGNASIQSDGSYYIEGYNDYGTHHIEFIGRKWKEQGVLQILKRYTRTIDESYTTIAGRTESLKTVFFGILADECRVGMLAYRTSTTVFSNV